MTGGARKEGENGELDRASIQPSFVSDDVLTSLRMLLTSRLYLDAKSAQTALTAGVDSMSVPSWGRTE